jgi:hypothetical protein
VQPRRHMAMGMLSPQLGMRQCRRLHQRPALRVQGCPIRRRLLFPHSRVTRERMVRLRGTVKAATAAVITAL